MSRQILFCLFLTLLYCIQQVFADDVAEIVAIKTFPAATDVFTPVFASGFDVPEDVARRYPAGFRIAPGEGRNGTAALFYERTDPNAYPIFSVPLRNLQPEMFYTVSVWVRGENIKATGNDKNIGAICVEYSQNGTWVSGGVYYSTNSIGTDWQQIDTMFKTPAAVATGLQTDLKFWHC